MKVKLRDVSNIIMGQSPDSSTYNTEKIGLPFFQGNADFGELNPIAKTWCSAPIKIAYKNYILISVRAPIGALNIAAETCCIGRGLAAFHVNNKMCTQKYLWYLLKAKKNELLSKGTGSTFKAISKNILSEMEFNIPPVREQELCTKVLDVVFCLIRLKKEQLDKLDLLVKSRFVEMFGNPKDNPKRFKSIRIGELTDVLTGSTPNRSNKDYYEGKIPWVKTGEIHPGHINSTEECISEVALKETTCKLLPVDTVMIAMYGQGKTRGQSGILGIKAATNQACAAILPCEKLNPVFLNQYLVIEYSRLRDMGRGAQQANLNLSMIKNYHILSIPIELQNQFADFVAQVDKSKFVVTAKFQ